MKSGHIILFMFLIVGAGLAKEQKAPRRPEDFSPFMFEYSAEQLVEKFSTNQMWRAEEEFKKLQAVNEKGAWKDSWESIDRHKAPEWYLDAKLGIMLNWGLHSVPAWDRNRNGAMYPDAYGCTMYTDSAVRRHHEEAWGLDFQWDDFAPLFTADKFDARALVSLFHEAGAKYLITMSKHHDGVAWWDSEWTMRNFVRMGPGKDLLSPLIKAAKQHDMKVVMYFCYEEWATAVLGENGRPRCRVWNWGSYGGTRPLNADSRRRVSGSVPVRNYYDQYMLPLVKEMVDRFNPDGLWMDGEWATPAETLRSRELVAYYYNKNEGRKDVYVNDRFGQGSRAKHGDVFISEYNIREAQTLDHPWEECQGISQSFAYNYEDTEASLGPPERLLHRFIDIVSRNGNLAIICGPDASGVFPENVVRRLKALGAWLKVNGESIYATRSLPPYQEGDVCYTQSKDGKCAYAICKQWPGRQLVLKGVRASHDSRITMLGVKKPLVWRQDEQALILEIPESLQNEKARPCEYAWAFRISKPE